MEDYNSSSNIIPELISKIDEKKSEASILAFLKLNMVNQKIILNDLEEHHISYLITICEKYNLKYEVIGFTKKLLIINNSSHKLFPDDNIYTTKKMGYTFLNKPSTKKYEYINYTNSTEISDYLKKYNMLDKTDIGDIGDIGDISKYISDNRDLENSDDDDNYDQDSFEEDSDDEVSNSNENINKKNINEQESSEDTNDNCESDESSSSYNSRKIKGVVIDYNNIFTKGESLIYMITTMNLICNICIMNKLYFS